MRRALAIFVVLVLAFAVLCAEFVLYSENTLYRNDNWVVAKRVHRMGLMGGSEFLLTRAPLAGNELHLSKWWGFQEVHSRASFTIDELQFSTRIDPKGYLDVTFGRQQGDEFVLRLNGQENEPSQIMQMDLEGRIVRVQGFGLSASVAGLHQVQVRFSEDSLSLRLDSGPEFLVPGHWMREGAFGFRGGFAPVSVDDVRVKDKSGAEFNESFANSQGRSQLILVNIMLALGIILSIAAVTHLRGRLMSWRDHAIKASAFVASATLSVALLFAFDFYLWSIHEMSGVTQPFLGQKHTLPFGWIEKARVGFFDAWYSLAGWEPASPEGLSRRGYLEEPQRIWNGPILCVGSKSDSCGPVSHAEISRMASGASERILFIGSSQTIGLGARDLSETFFARVHASIAGRFPQTGMVESLNMAMSGLTTTQLHSLLEEQYREFSPTQAVVDLPLNDSVDEIENAGEKIIRQLSERKSRVLLIKPPYSLEYPEKSAFEANHHAVDRLAKRFQVQVLDLHRALSSQEILNSGLIWADPIHLTSFGHARAAEEISKRLLEPQQL